MFKAHTEVQVAKKEDILYLKNKILSTRLTWADLYVINLDMTKKHDTYIRNIVAKRDLDIIRVEELPFVFVTGSTGTGKTIFVNRLMERNDLNAYVRGQTKFFDGYEENPVAIFNEFVDTTFTLQFLNQLADGTVKVLPVKHSTRLFSFSWFL